MVLRAVAGESRFPNGSFPPIADIDAGLSPAPAKHPRRPNEHSSNARWQHHHGGYGGQWETAHVSSILGDGCTEQHPPPLFDSARLTKAAFANPTSQGPLSPGA